MVSSDLIPAAALGRLGPGLAKAAGEAALSPCAGLEDAAVGGLGGIAAGLGFLLARSAGAGDRLIALVAPGAWIAERGGLMARGALAFGIPPGRLLIVRPRTEAEALWALEEILRSGAADLAIGAVEGASLTQTRRLDRVARESGATAALVRVRPGSPLSAARRRWRISALPSAPDPWDDRAPGAPRWRAELLRRRDGAPGCWDLEWNDETARLDLVAGLAGDGLGQGFRTIAAA
jgi:protein ImuA